jgi:hypothetical protein
MENLKFVLKHQDKVREEKHTQSMKVFVQEVVNDSSI